MAENYEGDSSGFTGCIVAIIGVPAAFFAVGASAAALTPGTQHDAGIGVLTGFVAAGAVVGLISWRVSRAKERFKNSRNRDLVQPLVAEVRAAFMKRGLRQLPDDAHHPAMILASALSNEGSRRIVGAWIGRSVQHQGVYVALSDRAVAAVGGDLGGVRSCPIAVVHARREEMDVVVDTPGGRWRLKMGDENLMRHIGAADRPVFGPNPAAVATANAIVDAIEVARRQVGPTLADSVKPPQWRLASEHIAEWSSRLHDMAARSADNVATLSCGGGVGDHMTEIVANEGSWRVTAASYSIPAGYTTAECTLSLARASKPTERGAANVAPLPEINEAVAGFQQRGVEHSTTLGAPPPQPDGRLSGPGSAAPWPDLTGSLSPGWNRRLHDLTVTTPLHEVVVMECQRDELDALLGGLATSREWIVLRVVSDGPPGASSQAFVRRVVLDAPHDPTRMLSGSLNAFVPTLVPGVVGAVAVTAGATHSAVLLADGTVLTFGDNRAGQLGVPYREGRLGGLSEPQRLSGLPPVSALAGGSTHTALLFTDGTVGVVGSAGDVQERAGASLMPKLLDDGGWCPDPLAVGAHSFRSIPGVEGAVSVAAGREYTVILRGDGRVLIYGINDNIGHQAKGSPPALGLIPIAERVAAIAAGENHVLLVTEQGGVFSFGSNATGQLGLALEVAASSPTRLNDLPPASGVAAGDTHSLVLLTDGSVAGFGANHYGQLGPVYDSLIVAGTPRRVVTSGSGPGVTALAAGDGTSMFVFDDGTVAGCGYNQWGQLGRARNPLLQGANSEVVAVGGITEASKVATGVGHTLVLSASGQVFSFGDGESGALGR